LQGFLGASIQLHLAVDQVPEGSMQRPDLDRAMRMMARATAEGRRVLQGLRSSEGEVEGLEESLSRIRDELRVADAIGLRVTVEGVERRVHPVIRDEVYKVGREALVNAFRHSQARGVEVAIEYSTRALRVRVRDDGAGIDSRLLEDDGTACRGLSAMRQTAERIGARLRVRSRAGEGTEVELTVPSAIAFRKRVVPTFRASEGLE
jgi:signal transduction histidine kinase